jgi:hypothetical protein
MKTRKGCVWKTKRGTVPLRRRRGRNVQPHPKASSSYIHKSHTRAYIHNHRPCCDVSCVCEKAPRGRAAFSSYFWPSSSSDDPLLLRRPHLFFLLQQIDTHIKANLFHRPPQHQHQHQHRQQQQHQPLFASLSLLPSSLAAAPRSPSAAAAVTTTAVL